MDIKKITIFLTAGHIALLSITCKKKVENGCQKMGYEYTYTQSACYYSPGYDSIAVGSIILLTASAPKTFIDETSHSSVTNTCQTISGPLHITMIYPLYQAAADSFELTAQIGKVIKDTINFSAGSLKGFRTIEWDGTPTDSFEIKVSIKPLAKGTFILALGQQGYRDSDCALYKYFLNVGNDQHLYYFSQFNNGYIGDYERNFGYYFKVY